MTFLDCCKKKKKHYLSTHENKKKRQQTLYQADEEQETIRLYPLICLSAKVFSSKLHLLWKRPFTN